MSCRRVHWLTRRRNRDGWICTTDAQGAARLQRAALLLFTRRPWGTRRAHPSHALGAAPSPRCRASSATSRKMDLPRGRAPRCPRYQRGASLSTLWQNKVVPAARRKHSPLIGLPADPLAVPAPPGRLREWGFLSELHRPNTAYDAAASAARPGTGKCGPPRMCAGFSRLRVGCIAAYACGPKGAGGATCTRTPRWARSFEVRVSACFTTPAENGAEGETCTPKAHWLSTRSVC